jgi:hypothetical protein
MAECPRLLAVYGDDVLIFSDKDINWPAVAVEAAWLSE